MSGGKARKSGLNAEEMLQQENDHLTDNLTMKVSSLKSLASDIERETRSQNVQLDDMDDSFGGAGTLLSGTVNRVKGMLLVGSSNRKLTCYFAIALIILFFLFYYLFTKVTHK
ncbi:BET1-like protein [Corticium candelabrum]|uniref:BET1-like protein n=1 Tax=Corticium candelabrum TaxID=121492 RepID=UPI002E268CE7|nr:BET1-like protein [Corticium candelabrum]